MSVSKTGIELLDWFQKGLKPIRMMTVSDWADTNRMLTSDSSAEPGPWRTSRTPYLKEILDNMSPSSPVQEVVVQKGAQLGFTEAGVNILGTYIDLDPCNMLYVMPTEDMAETISKTRFDPMVTNSKVLEEKVASKRARDGGNTNRSKQYPGGMLTFTGANSAVGLRSRSVRILIADEVDGYPADIDGEGSPLQLAKKRTNTYGERKKVYIPSTPTVEGASAIEKEFNTTDKRYFFVPCPECGTFQTLKFEQLRWEKPRYIHTKYECEHCGHLIEERHKPRMLAKGEWKPTEEANISRIRRGYHINSLYSPLGWLSWGEIANEWDDAQNDDAKMKTFVNTVLGETYKEESEVPGFEALYDRREDYTMGVVPTDVCILTAGVDVQKDRVELEVVGWCAGKRSYSIEYVVLHGDTAEQGVWTQLSAVVNKQWPRADGSTMGLARMAVDRGYNTSLVDAFCGRFSPLKVVPVKGSDTLTRIVGAPMPCRTTQTGKPLPGLKYYPVGSGVVKAEVYAWLRLHRQEDGSYPEGYCHFPQYEMGYFRGLTAEKLVYVGNNKGHGSLQWHKHYKRNEPLDCRVYARAAAALVGIDRFQERDWTSLKEQYVDNPEGKTVQKKAEPKKNSFLGSRGKNWLK